MFCTTWRKGARRIWILPRNAHCDLLYAIANYLPIFDELCRLMYNFLFSCLNSDSRFIRSIVVLGVRYGRWISLIACNAVLCLLHLRMKFSITAIQKLSAGMLRSRILLGLGL